MKTHNLKKLSIAQLVAIFEDLAIAQHRAELEDRTALYNKLYDQMQFVRSELQHREGDQRRALVALHRHPNAQVRLMSASSTLALAPAESQSVLKELAGSKIFPQAANAGFLLNGFESGRFKPS